MLMNRRDFLQVMKAAPFLPASSGVVPAIGGSIGSQGGDYGVRFVDVAREAGLRHKIYFGAEAAWKYILETTGCGVAFFDYDNDGWLDIFIVNGWRLEGFPRGEEPANHLYHNNRDGTFTDVTAIAGLVHSGWGQGVCIGDYDNDGFDDLFLTYWGNNVLYHNNGNGTFTDVSARAGVRGRQTRWGTGCAFVDYDRDGYLDLMVANYLVFDQKSAPQPGTGVFCEYLGLSVNCGPGGLIPENCLLYHNNGDGTFSDVTEKAGIKCRDPYFGLNVLTGDFNNDGWPDIYVSGDSSASRLFQNNRNGTFTDIAVSGGVAYSDVGIPQAGMGVAAGDYDCDGWLDIYKTNFSQQVPNLYHNNRDSSFSDVSEQAGMSINSKLLGWGCGFADFDNDGWTDIFQCNGHVYPEVDRLHSDVTFRQPKVVYRNLKNGRFRDVTGEAGACLLQPNASRGCAFGDFDNDGDLDVLVSNINGVPSLLRCDVSSGHHWIKVRAIGTHSNRSGIGTRIKCVTGEHWQIDEVRSGSSHFSQHDLRVHFGLGKADRVDLLELRWPNGGVESFCNLDVNQLIYIQEGKGITRTDKFKS
jgi:hypothetical protein